MYSSVHHVTRGLFITLQHPACVVLMYSSVHHFTGGLFIMLRHPACVVLWYLPSRHMVTNNRCSLAKPPLLQDYTVVHYSGAPLLSKSTHPRKFGNHVTIHRPPAVRPHHRKTNVYSHTFS